MADGDRKGGRRTGDGVRDGIPKPTSGTPLRAAITKRLATTKRCRPITEDHAQLPFRGAHTVSSPGASNLSNTQMKQKEFE
jgi:hypothetical protein